MASLPNVTDIGDLSTLGVSSAVKTVLDAKYTDASAWAVWAAQLLQQNIVDTTNLLTNHEIETDLDAIIAQLNQYLTPPTISSPDATGIFSETLVGALRDKLLTMLADGGTGLGATAEAIIFARDQARVTAERAIAYNEAASQFSSFPYPPGQLLAKLTEISNETSRRLADSSAEILKLSAQLQQDTNKHILTTTLQFINVLADVYNNEELRKLEVYKTKVTMEIEAYKTALLFYTSRTDALIKVASLDIEAKARQLTLSLEIIKGIAQSAAQMVASALNSVNVSSSLGFSGNISDSTTESTSESVQHIFEGV